MLDRDRLLVDITSVELDAAVVLGVLGRSDLVRHAIGRLVAGEDTAALADLAGEPLDPRRIDTAHLDVLWQRVLADDGVDPAPPDAAVLIHAGHLLRTWHAGRLAHREALSALANLCPPLAPTSAFTPISRDLLQDETGLVAAADKGVPATELDEGARAAVEACAVRYRELGRPTG